jgi:hypothetical protein
MQNRASTTLHVCANVVVMSEPQLSSPLHFILSTTPESSPRGALESPYYGIRGWHISYRLFVYESMDGVDAKLYQEERVGEKAHVVHHGVHGCKAVVVGIEVCCAGDGFDGRGDHLV